MMACVYEVGPGTGALTKPILEAGAKVVAVEIDPERAAGLRQHCSKELASGIPAPALLRMPAALSPMSASPGVSSPIRHSNTAPNY